MRNLELPGEEFLIVTYRFDEEFNYELESIIPEPEADGNGGFIVPKQRVQLQPGDMVQLLYEGFNEVTDEEFFVVDDDAIITIENGNEDLELEYDMLEVGNYQLGYLLEDHSQNDTIIFDPTIYTVSGTGLETISNDNIFEVYPNPTVGVFSLAVTDLQADNFEIVIYDFAGRLVHQQAGSLGVITLDLELINGMYTIEIVTDTQRIVDKLVIQK